MHALLLAVAITGFVTAGTTNKDRYVEASWGIAPPASYPFLPFSNMTAASCDATDIL